MWEKMHLGNGCTQVVTTCLFRDGLKVIGGGYSVENPNDERDETNMLGIHWAFKRAILAMCKNFGLRHTAYINKEYMQKVDKAFRLAFFYARKKC
jgi:hypothetical protein